ncbi:MAG: DHHA1 domain-containing protein, partial [Chloroflexota bacterium]
ALAGAAAYTYLNEMREGVEEASRALDTVPERLVARTKQLTEELRDREKRIEVLRGQLAQREAEQLLSEGFSVDGMTVVATQVRADSVDYLQAVTDAVRSRLGRGAVVLAGIIDGKPVFTMALTSNADADLKANVILRKAAKVAQGGAGGTAEFAQGGGRDVDQVDAVLATAVNAIKAQVED